LGCGAFWVFGFLTTTYSGLLIDRSTRFRRKIDMAAGRKTGGRQKGSRNRAMLTIERAAAVTAAMVRGGLVDVFSGDAHALLMLVYKDQTQEMPLRIDAAKAAIRYEKPALSSVTMDALVRGDPRKLTDEELAGHIGAGRPRIDPAPEDTDGPDDVV